MAEVRAFLSTFKTSKCHDKYYHELHTCHDFHSDKDRRRDPYTSFYSEHASDNLVERAYHPLRYQTKLCPKETKRKGSCSYGKICAHAHKQSELREPFDPQIKDVRERATTLQLDIAVAGVRPTTSHNRNSLRPVARSLVSQQNLPTMYNWGEAPAVGADVTGFDLTLRDMFVAVKIWDILKAIASSCLCKIRIEVVRESEYNRLIVSGTHARYVLGDVVRMLANPPEDLIGTAVRPYHLLVTTRVQQHQAKHGQVAFLSQDTVRTETAMVDVHAKSVAVLYTNKGPKSVDVAHGAFKRIDRWVQDVGLDVLHECIACCETFTSEDGVVCPSGHFCCSVSSSNLDCEPDDGGCFSGLFQAQVQCLKFQDGAVKCPVCNESLSAQNMAKVLSSHAWEKLQTAVMDIKVKQQCETLQSEFDKRLDRKVQDMLEQYGNQGGVLKMQAERAAAEARNTTLNLSCPHCNAVYAEFDGCMALVCAHCGGHFCAYCHKRSPTSRGCHEHVRECDANLTDNGSYYADIAIIKKSQRRYRVKALKRHLRDKQYKKALYNAVVIELNQDLIDLGVDSARLFDFGNLQQD